MQKVYLVYEGGGYDYGSDCNDDCEHVEAAYATRELATDHANRWKEKMINEPDVRNPELWSFDERVHDESESSVIVEYTFSLGESEWTYCSVMTMDILEELKEL